MNKYLTYHDNNRQENQSAYFLPDTQADVLNRFSATRYPPPNTLSKIVNRKMLPLIDST